MSFLPYRIIIFVLMCMIALAVPCRDIFAEDLSGRTFFQKGKKALDAGRHAEAASNFSEAIKTFPILEDYSLFFLADAYRLMGDHGESLKHIRVLLERFPQSPLVQQARAAEIREAKENQEDDLFTLFESYTQDYPADEQMLFQFGRFLRQQGNTTKSAEIFKKLYVSAGPLSLQALSEVDVTGIEAEDLIARASNLFKKYEFRDAESDLRRAFSMDDGKKSEEILKSLGYALFRQKKYRDAAAVFDRVNDLYYKARSLYRAGEAAEFEKTLTVLIEKNDLNAGSLLTAVASDKRRDKSFDEALAIYQNVIDRYPAEYENAKWEIGWTYYLAAQYEKSDKIFADLHLKFDDPKYLYWHARSREALGLDAGGLYDALARTENNYYSFLAFLRKKSGALDKVSTKDTQIEISSDNKKLFERVETLQSMEMNAEAVAELRNVTKRVESPSDLFFLMIKMQELGEFKRSIGLATRFPYSEKVHRFWYPLAFWGDVEKISEKYGLDPLVVLSVMREESRFDTVARSVAGALGLMQIMPATAYRLDRKLELGIKKDSQITDIRKNIHLGSYYLKLLTEEFKSLAHAVAAYNAGEVAVRKWQKRWNYAAVDEFIEDIPYSETRNYVKKVLNSYFQYKKSIGSESPERILNMISGTL